MYVGMITEKVSRILCVCLLVLSMTACQTTVKKTDHVRKKPDTSIQQTNQLRAEKIKLTVENNLLLAQKLNLNELNRRLKNEVQEKTVMVEQLKNKSIKVTFLNSILFPFGSFELSKQGRSAIVTLKDIIKQHIQQGGIIRIIGHTDNVDVNKYNRTYKDNWDLSSLRAASVVRVLIWGLHFNPNTFRVEGHASTEPRASNTTEKGRAQNRRIEILLTSK